MRYYDIRILEDDGTLIRQFSSNTPAGVHNPNALQLEVDIQRYGLSTPKGNSLVRLYGVSIKELRQSTQNYANKRIQVHLGMSKGLPLAREKQAGLAIEGIIQQPFGNWQGITQSMDFFITAGYGSLSNPKNIVLQWSKGQKLSTALFFSLQRGFPGMKITVNIDDRLVAPQESGGMYPSLSQLATQLNAWSRSVITDNGYPGVDISMNNNEIKVWDTSDKKKTTGVPVQVDFIDLVGQPTWIEAQKMSLAVVMRCDIQTGDYIKMPPGALVTVTAGSYAQYRAQSAFQGSFMVTDVRMIGNSRQPDAANWITVIEAIPV